MTNIQLVGERVEKTSIQLEWVEDGEQCCAAVGERGENDKYPAGKKTDLCHAAVGERGENDKYPAGEKTETYVVLL